MKNFLVWFFIGFASCQAQTYCDESGNDSTYQETFTGSSTSSGRNITASGCPNHYNHATNPNSATVQNHNFEVYAYPCFANDTLNVTCTVDGLGILRNGVVLYGQAVGLTDCSDAVVSEADTFDYCGGHADGQGAYHYHIPPTCLLKQLNIAQEQSHGDILGWALDGFPIYGPYGQTKNLMYQCTDTGFANQSDCVDECGGHLQHTVDGYLYHYHILGNISDGVTNPVNPYPSVLFNPYSIACFRGVLKNKPFYISTTKSFSCSSNGYESGFVPEILTGVTTVYSDANNYFLGFVLIVVSIMLILQ